MRIAQYKSVAEVNAALAAVVTAGTEILAGPVTAAVRDNGSLIYIVTLIDDPA